MTCHFLYSDVMLENKRHGGIFKFGLCIMKLFNFAYINKIFTNITKAIYVGVKKENIIITRPFVNLSISIGKRY